MVTTIIFLHIVGIVARDVRGAPWGRALPSGLGNSSSIRVGDPEGSGFRRHTSPLLGSEVFVTRRNEGSSTHLIYGDT